MNETTVVRSLALVVWVFVMYRMPHLDPPPTRAGRFSGPSAVVLLLGVLTIGAAHIIPIDSLAGVYTLATFLAGLLGLALLMLTRPRR